MLPHSHSSNSQMRVHASEEYDVRRVHPSWSHMIKTPDFGVRDRFPTMDYIWPRILLVPCSSLSWALGIAPVSLPWAL